MLMAPDYPQLGMPVSIISRYRQLRSLLSESEKYYFGGPGRDQLVDLMQIHDWYAAYARIPPYSRPLGAISKRQRSTFSILCRL